ncbi:MAG TPA: hypothetical protein QGH10_18315 [Armatimonadota bacterium]|nr:hypothetical protein [Armatimonadota bacterium]
MATTLTGLIPSAPPPLKLTIRNKQALRTCIDEAREEAAEYVRRGTTKVAHDAKLPRDFARRLITALQAVLLPVVEDVAYSEARRQPKAPDVNKAMARRRRQADVLTAARETLGEVLHTSVATAQIRQGDMAAGSPVAEAYSSAAEVLTDALVYIEKEIAALQQTTRKQTAGRKVDSWAGALKFTVGQWWYSQGCVPTETRSGAYHSVLLILLHAKAEQRGSKPPKVLRLRETLAKLASPDNRQVLRIRIRT